MAENRKEIEYISLQDQQQFAAKVQQMLAEKPSQAAYVHSYGCQANVAEGEKIKGVLSQMGYGFTDDIQQADLIMLNTCAVREGAEDRVFGNVGALKHQKRRNPELVIGLCGCMMQQKTVVDRLRRSFPHVDLVFGTNAIHRLPQMLFECLTHGRVIEKPEDVIDTTVVEEIPTRRDNTLKAWLPIMYGCDNFCSYCIVPYVRGRERSRSPQRVLEEARRIIAGGAKEITLLGQNVNSYGKGLPEEERMNFAQFLREINAIPGEFRIRFMTSHPKDCTHELIDAMAECKKVAPFLHLPVQSGSDRVLAEMNRRYTAEHYLSLIDYARSRIPGITFSSDIIVGFPGETEEDFEKTMELIRKVKYSNLFTFIYSPRGGTKAAEMEDPIPAKEKSRWFQGMLKEQEQIVRKLHEEMVGSIHRVLVEDDHGEEKDGLHHLAGRTGTNILTEFYGSPDLVGQFVDVKITKAFNRSVEGEII